MSVEEEGEGVDDLEVAVVNPGRTEHAVVWGRGGGGVELTLLSN